MESKELSERMRAAVSYSWRVFSRKVGNGLIPINKEASMQLQYAHILQQLLPFITFHENEKFEIELESNGIINGRSREIDLTFSGKGNGHEYHKIAIEMKCYRTLSASNGNRGATDIFMKDVYEDFYLLEQYVSCGIAQEGVSLVMNELSRLVQPKNKKAKCWDYDISNGAVFGPITLNTPIGGKTIDIRLGMTYVLNWVKHGEFWFLETQGVQV
ncbi:hypothetical protein BTA51_29495 [Hahella sp. CCB-MM4]|uniref:hypothetical protein n=1 Tax=Hahella sp. (strain CCB-MM4) TaxID=1926491 RepID=UPI000B9ABA4A|nr:hypothetical protein [Hahella sp. CCB-MM4]OZG69760.1 hypothetical protein BTA51_29495 [Hahella sp. CCB-MM4]